MENNDKYLQNLRPGTCRRCLKHNKKRSAEKADRLRREMNHPENICRVSSRTHHHPTGKPQDKYYEEVLGPCQDSYTNRKSKDKYYAEVLSPFQVRCATRKSQDKHYEEMLGPCQDSYTTRKSQDKLYKKVFCQCQDCCPTQKPQDKHYEELFSPFQDRYSNQEPQDEHYEEVQDKHYDEVLCPCQDRTCPFNVGQYILLGLDSPLFKTHRVYDTLAEPGLTYRKHSKPKDVNHRSSRQSQYFDYPSIPELHLPQSENEEEEEMDCRICKSMSREPSSKSPNKTPHNKSYRTDDHEYYEAAGLARNATSKSLHVTRTGDDLRAAVRQQIEEQEALEEMKRRSRKAEVSSGSSASEETVRRARDPEPQSSEKSLPKESSFDRVDFRLSVEDIVQFQILDPLTLQIQHLFQNIRRNDLSFIEDLRTIPAQVREIHMQSGTKCN